MNFHGLLQQALASHQQGRLDEAEQGYLLLIEKFPPDPGVFNLLGTLHYQTGRLESAVHWLRRAIEINPREPLFHFNLGRFLTEAGRRDEARSAYERAIELNPGFVEALDSLGNLMLDAGEPKVAGSLFTRSLAERPDGLVALNGLGIACREQGRQDEALGHFGRAAALNPSHAASLFNLGKQLLLSGRPAEGEALAGRALAAGAAPAEAWYLTGKCLDAQARLPEALAAFRQAQTLDPEDGDKAFAVANALMQMGEHRESLAVFRGALSSHPGSWDLANAYLMLLGYSDEPCAEEVFQAHVDVMRRFVGGERVEIERHVRQVRPRLRIGFVSGDLREHPVAVFLEPLLRHLDREKFEIYCYSALGAGDAVTDRLRGLADGWRVLEGLSDKQAASLIRNDGVDILVDLSGHTRHNRLRVFALKPAPVQVSWLGYLNTTGLGNMDWRLTDAIASPPEAAAWHTERLYRLPCCQWCYSAPEVAPAVSDAPLARRGYPMFGAFHNPAKITASAIALWSRVLQAVPDSRLLLVGAGTGGLDGLFRERFARHGVAPERLDMHKSLPFRDYLALHGEVDVMLDTLPYTGGTTTFHALWMGVPVVTLAGRGVAHRGGATILGHMGLRQWVADTPEQFVSAASSLVGDVPGLVQVRSGLRDRLECSPLMDAKSFAHEMGQAFLAMHSQGSL